MNKRALFLYLVFLCSNSAFAQVVRGVVGHIVSGDPIEFANVYLANTVTGTVTDSTGAFVLKGFEPGKYDLTVSFVGFSTYSIPIELGVGQELDLNITLHTEVLSLPEVFITADTSRWNNYFQVFCNYFLGTTPGSKECKILNYRSLNFYFDQSQNTLYAHTREPIKVINNWLGYEIDYDMRSFRMDFDKGRLTCEGVPRFSCLDPKNRFDAKRWEKNRQLEYTGSLLHFFRSVYADKLKDNQYEVRTIKRIPDPDRLPEAVVSRKIRFFRSKLEEHKPTNQVCDVNWADSLKRYRQIQAQPGFVDIPGNEFASANELIENSIIAYNGILQVTYLGEKEHKKYPFKRNSRRKSGYQRSRLYITDELKVYENGYYEDVQSTYVEGYWSWKGSIAGILPMNYRLPDE
ncbi:carboxypeptidase-like regulatory domain-containing protein [Fulvivirga sp. M361]|nr:carboxypeptidase-like regulatory domain-containing protein [Fulvivirga sp. M361]